jgi:uncharacterized protein (DUF433 family)
MRLEDYFDFLAPNDIRIKGSRIGIETVLYGYVHNCRTPEEIAEQFDTITLEEVYATIPYYLHNKEQVSRYLADYLEYCLKSEAEARKNPSPATQRLRKIKAQLERYPPEERHAALQRILAEEKREAWEAARAGGAAVT